MSASRPSMAVVIPAHNEANRIGTAVQCLLDQSEPPSEIVVCDDGSSDAIRAALQGFGDRVTLVRQPNRGPAAARNNGAAHVDADWILFLDADDWLSERFLERVRDVAQNTPSVDLIVSDALGIDDADGRVLYRHYERTNFAYHDQRCAIVERNFLLTGVSVRRDAWVGVGGFAEDLPVCEDWDCWLRMIFAGCTVELVDDALLYRRHHDDNLSSSRGKMLAGRVEVLERALREQRLSRRERRLALRSLEDNRSAFRWLQGQELLARFGDDGPRTTSDRAKALRLAVARGTPTKRRVALFAAAIAPVTVGRQMRRRRVAATTSDRARTRAPGTDRHGQEVVASSDAMAKKPRSLSQ